MLLKRLVAHIANSPVDKLHPLNIGQCDVISAEGGDKGFDGDVVAYLETQYRSWSVRQLKVALAERDRRTAGR